MMKIIFTILILLTGNIFLANAQTADWNAVLPANFPTNVSGQIHGISRVSQMKFHPSNLNKMYAISACGGLYISNNGGNNWTVSPGTDKMPLKNLASVCIDPTNDQVIYVGTGDHNYYGAGIGVWKSVDGGLNFEQTSLTGRLVIDMLTDPLDHNIIVAITDAGIYKTIDGGQNWVLKTTARSFDDLKQKTPVSRVLYAATNDSAFFRSTDFGDNWLQITNGIVLPAGITNGNGCRIAVTPADTNTVYLGMVTNGGLVYRSTNGGNSFSIVKTAGSPYLTYYDNNASSSGQGDYNFGIGADRLDANILYLVAHNVWKSTNGGANWSQLTNWYQKVHTDMHQVNTSPYNNGQLWNMNDGGVWLSTDGGNNWVPKSDGIYGYEIYRGNCSPTLKEMHSIGTQDNGELYANNSGWFTNRGGDWGSPCAFDYRDGSSMVYYFENRTRRLVNGGASTFGVPGGNESFNDIAFHRSNPDLAFLGDSIIYRTTNLTEANPAWEQLSNLHKQVAAMHCSYTDANRLYVVTKDGFIYVSTNALSATPQFTAYQLPVANFDRASITSIKTSPNTIYIHCGRQVFRSINNGASWTDITYNLPPLTHVRILADEYYSNNELVFVATYNAVYFKVKNQSSWSVYAGNLPYRSYLSDLSIFNDSTSNSSLRVYTYGRGVWQTTINNLRVLNARLEADNTNPCIGTTVHFADISTGNVVSRSWSFPGGNPSTSTDEFPVVTYSSSGNFDVSLNVSDGTTNSSTTSTTYISTSAAALPVAEGFEGTDDPPVGWKNLDGATAGYKWAKTTLAGGYGTSPSSMYFDNYSWNIPGEKDELQSKRFDLSGYSAAQLNFDVAYQVFPGAADSLTILVSTDCGQSFTRLYSKGGTGLSTAGSSQGYFVPNAAQWRTETIDLSAYIGQPGVIIEFENVNYYGNNLFIDNINITGTPLALVYKFTGDGNWDVASNWLNNTIPPAVLTGSAEIIIDPVVNGECVLNVVQQINNNAKLTVKLGKKFRVIGNLIINN